MENHKSKRIHFIEVAKDIYAAITPADELDITDAGMMDNFSNSAFINRGEGLVCDTYYDLTHAQELKDFCIERSGHAPGYVVNTHGHWDHFWGNQIFAEAKVLGHRDMLKDCADDAGKLRIFKLLNKSKWIQSFLNFIVTKMFGNYLEQGTKTKVVVTVGENDFDLSEVVPTPPTELFDQNVTINLDGTEVQLLHLGAIHSSSDTVVWLPEEKVLFAGDIFADCSMPTSLEGGKRWIEVMDYILDELQPEVIVPGHGVVYDRTRAKNQREYFKTLVEQFEANYTDTITAQELCEKIDVKRFVDHRPRLGGVMAVNTMLSEKRKKK